MGHVKPKAKALGYLIVLTLAKSRFLAEMKTRKAKAKALNAKGAMFKDKGCKVRQKQKL